MPTCNIATSPRTFTPWGSFACLPRPSHLGPWPRERQQREVGLASSLAPHSWTVICSSPLQSRRGQEYQLTLSWWVKLVLWTELEWLDPSPGVVETALFSW